MGLSQAPGSAPHYQLVAVHSQGRAVRSLAVPRTAVPKQGLQPLIFQTRWFKETLKMGWGGE